MPSRKRRYSYKEKKHRMTNALQNHCEVENYVILSCMDYETVLLMTFGKKPETWGVGYKDKNMSLIRNFSFFFFFFLDITYVLCFFVSFSRISSSSYTRF